MNPLLQSVPTNLPDPPYPDDTKANGWKPPLDLDRILQSKTWILADKNIRPWLIMVWMLSWRNVPAGSYDNDMEMIAAQIGCEEDFLTLHKKSLLRGWDVYSDGRLYHPFIVSQVLDVLEGRRNGAKRQKKSREKNKDNGSDNVTRQSHDVTRQSQSVTRCHGADGTGLDWKGLEERKEKDIAPAVAKSSPMKKESPKKSPLNFDSWPQQPDPDQWSEIAGFRKSKKAKNTQRAIDLLGKQLHKAVAAGHPFQICIDLWEEKQWAAFNADWIQNANSSGGPFGNKPQQHHLPQLARENFS